MRARKKFGIAIAIRIRMMATTTSSSISENPRTFRLTRHLVRFLGAGMKI
jgi:hypothetical protein